MSSEVHPAQRRFRVTRRGVLLGVGAAGAGLVVGAVLGRNHIYGAIGRLLAEGTMPGGGGETDPAVWFEVLPTDVVRLIVPKVEMGQGAHTALAQIAADELGAAWAQIEVVQGDTASGPADGMGTVGSASVSGLYTPLRTAAATLREMLVARAAQRLGTDRALLEAADGEVRSRADPGASLRFGDIVAGVEEWPELDEAPRLKSPDEFRFIGRSMPRIDVETKLRGQARYGYDLRADGMAYGAVARPPQVGAIMVAAAPGSAAEHPGVIDVVIDPERQFAGVVAGTRQQAREAVAKLDIEWRTDRVWQQRDIDALLDVEDRAGIPIQKDGNALRVLEEATTLTAEYTAPLAAHAQLEPQAALADVTDERARVQVSTQMASAARGEIASALGFKAANVVVTPAYLGGGFGRKTGFEPGVEAALLSRAAKRPVHVGWTRAEDMREGFFRPPIRSRFAARIENGRIAALKHNHASGEVLFSFFPALLSYALGADPGAWRGAYNIYGRIEHRLLSTLTAKLPVPTGAWRGLGLFSNTFACESFMDEMAHAAGADPLQFRLDHLGDDRTGRRMRAVLEAVAERADYGRTLPEGRAQGVACCVDVGTVVAMIAEVSVEGDGTIHVHRVTQAVEAGLVVNPDGALAQAQGSIVMGLSSTLLEQVTLEDGVIVAENFDRYPLLTMDRTPDIDVVFLDSDEPPNGMGEPSIGPVAAAVGNAVFKLSGRRLRRVPFRPEDVAAGNHSLGGVG
jgi:isoquinoline 1-oxidoreductase subunit beta